MTTETALVLIALVVVGTSVSWALMWWMVTTRNRRVMRRLLREMRRDEYGEAED